MKTKMKSIIFTAIIFLYSVDLSAQKKWTLNECIERAINKNISIKQSKLDLKNTSLSLIYYLKTISLFLLFSLVTKINGPKLQNIEAKKTKMVFILGHLHLLEQQIGQ